jgi:hypothetical protein
MEAIHFSSSFGKTNLMFHHEANKDEEDETIHLFFIVENNLLSHVEVATEEETIISLSCGNDLLFHVEVEKKATIISHSFFLFYM